MSDHFPVAAMVIGMWKSGNEGGMGQDFIGYILGRVAHSLPGYTERALRGLK